MGKSTIFIGDANLKGIIVCIKVNHRLMWLPYFYNYLSFLLVAL